MQRCWFRCGVGVAYREDCDEIVASQFREKLLELSKSYQHRLMDGISVAYAGVPVNSSMKLRFMTNRNGFLAYPRTVYQVKDGILRMEMPPESSAVLIW